MRIEHRAPQGKQDIDSAICARCEVMFHAVCERDARLSNQALQRALLERPDHVARLDLLLFGAPVTASVMMAVKLNAPQNPPNHAYQGAFVNPAHVTPCLVRRTYAPIASVPMKNDSSTMIHVLIERFHNSLLTDWLAYAARNRLYVSQDGGVFWRALPFELPDVEAVSFRES